MTWFVYILECSDQTYYVGSTNDVEKRLYAHNHLRTAAKYTRSRRPVVLRYREECRDISSARRRELELKKLSRAMKISLIENSKEWYTESVTRISPNNSMAKGNNARKKEAKKPKKAKK